MNRLKEPSTWAAVAALAALAGHPLPDDLMQGMPQLVGLFGALLGMVLPEKRA